MVIAIALVYFKPHLILLQYSLKTYYWMFTYVQSTFYPFRNNPNDMNNVLPSYICIANYQYIYFNTFFVGINIAKIIKKMLIVFPADSWKCPPLSLYSYEKKKRSKKIRKAINCVLAGCLLYQRAQGTCPLISCVKIQGYLLKIINPLILGQIKLCMDHVNKNPKKNQNFDISICKIVLL